MNAGNLLLAIRDGISLLQSKGCLTPTGEFDEHVFNDVAKIAELAAGIESILKSHGVVIPDKLEKIIQILPLLAGLLK